MMSYVLAVVTQLNSGGNEVTIKARGKAISLAVDVVENVRRKFLSDAKIKNISISTEELTGDNGEKGDVSAIEITLKR